MKKLIANDIVIIASGCSAQAAARAGLMDKAAKDLCGAGLEHLGRGTTESMDEFIVVIEPGARSVQTYKNVKRLAKDLGVSQVKVVANKVRNPEDEEFIRNKIPAEDLLGMIHYNTEVIDADRQGKSPYDFSKTVTAEIIKIKEKIDQNSIL